MKLLPHKYLGIPAGIFCCLLSLAFYDVVFLGKTFKVTTANSQALPTGAYGQEDNKPSFIPVNGTDSPVLEEPIYQFIKKNLQRGILPLWNPHQACGFPLIGMIEIGLFYPLTLIMYLLPELYAWDVLILTRFFLAALLTYAFMRRMGFRIIPSLGSGIAFMLSGPMVLLQYWTANVDILTPALLIAVDQLIKKPTSRAVAFLSFIVALTIFAGHPEHIFLVNVFGTAFFIFRLWKARTQAPVKKIIGAWGLAYVLGAGLAAVVLFPFLKNMLSEFWHGHPPGVGAAMEEQRHRALSLALPHFFQQAPVTYQWVFSGWWGGYLGTLPLGLAFLSLFKNHKNGLNYFFATTAFVIIGKEYGLPIINLIGYLPIFNICRYAIHTPALAAFAVAVCAGMGIQTALETPRVFLKGCLYAFGLLLIVAGHLFFLKNSETIITAWKATGFCGIILLIFLLILLHKDRRTLSPRWIGILLVAALFLELFAYIHRERPRRFASFGQVPYLDFLKASPRRIRSYGNFWAFYPNTATGFGVDDLGFFFGLAPKRFVTFTNHLLMKDIFQKDLRPPALRAIPIPEDRKPILDMLNVKYIITPATERFTRAFRHFEKISQRLDNVYDREVKIYERPEAFGRVYIVHKAVFQPDPERALDMVRLLENRLDQVAVVLSPVIPKILAMLKDAPAVDRSTAQIASYTANEVTIRVLMEHPGFLVLSDAYHPDWEVFVNGKPWKLFQTNYLIRSVFLPKGIYVVRYVFRPRSFRLGLWVSLLTAGILLLCLSWPTWRRCRQPRP